jgi:hypothetical protein
MRSRFHCAVDAVSPHHRRTETMSFLSSIQGSAMDGRSTSNSATGHGGDGGGGSSSSGGGSGGKRSGDGGNGSQGGGKH